MFQMKGSREIKWWNRPWSKRLTVVYGLVFGVVLETILFLFLTDSVVAPVLAGGALGFGAMRLLVESSRKNLLGESDQASNFAFGVSFAISIIATYLVLYVIFFAYL